MIVRRIRQPRVVKRRQRAFFRLVLQYYRDASKARQDELDACLITNLALPFVNEIILVADVALPVGLIGTPPSLRPCLPMELPNPHPSGRPTFRQLLAVLTARSGDSDINVLCNSDIYFDESLRHAAAMRPVGVPYRAMRSLPAGSCPGPAANGAGDAPGSATNSSSTSVAGEPRNGTPTVERAGLGSAANVSAQAASKPA